MPTLYKKTDRKPIPEGAEILTRKGVRHARWTDKRGRTRTEPLADDGTAVLVERGYWVFDYQGPDGWVKGNKGYTDKEATVALAQRLERDAARTKQGLTPTVDPARAQTHYSEALDSWLDRLRHDNLDDTYVSNMRRLVTKMAKGCGWATLASIRADRAAAWLLDIKRNGVPDKDGVRKAKPPSDRTVDQYLEERPGVSQVVCGVRLSPRRPVSVGQEGTKAEAGEAPSGLLARRAPGPAERRRHPRARVPDRRADRAPQGRTAPAPVARLPARTGHALHRAPPRSE